MQLITLFRPVGQQELDLVEASGFKAFPPRLEWQPIFYPVMNAAYAAQIAAEWNTKDAFSGFVGYVTDLISRRNSWSSSLFKMWAAKCTKSRGYLLTNRLRSMATS